MEAAQRAVEKGDVALIGVNVHALPEKDDRLLRDIATAKIETWHSHTSEIELFKRQRDAASLRAALDGVAAAVAGSENLVPRVIEALDASATIGEIVTTMRRALGIAPDIFDHVISDQVVHGQATPDRPVGARHVA
jgi:methylmalonyl-CoA mutase N-terminal domain/subunit